MNFRLATHLFANKKLQEFPIFCFFFQLLQVAISLCRNFEQFARKILLLPMLLSPTNFNIQPSMLAVVLMLRYQGEDDCSQSEAQCAGFRLFCSIIFHMYTKEDDCSQSSMCIYHIYTFSPPPSGSSIFADILRQVPFK